jgi:predicted HicB family RNase H-like nuclease
MNNGSDRVAKTIRMSEEAYHAARVAAVTSKKSLGQWLEEAIFEKVSREQSSVGC